MSTATLNKPTVRDIVAMLQELPQDMPFRLRDPDTGWTIQQVDFWQDRGILWFSGSYDAMIVGDDE